MQKLINAVQHYAWGSQRALTDLYNMANPNNLPMAELWMGAHPKSSSQVLNATGQPVSLRDEISAAPERLLGQAVAARFGELPFLLKVLCAAQPLSIQVHPDKAASEAGFARENALGIALDAAERNYKDPNHKPELVFAVTPFLAMNAFREFADAARLLAEVKHAHPLIEAFCQAPDAERLKALFAGLLALEGDAKTQALAVLNTVLDAQTGEPWDTIRIIAKDYPHDSGLFSPLLLNVVRLAPGEAMFLFAKTPHAYLNGVALEVMANSDNVLRAGLTPKYIDIPELVANVDFIPRPASSLMTLPLCDATSEIFPIPVDDFAFSLHRLSDRPVTLEQQSAAIVFCLEGEAQLSCGKQQLVLKPGESAFMGADESPVTVTGEGRLARVYNHLN